MLEILKLQLVLKEKHTPQQLENRASKILKRFYNRFSQSHHLFIRPDTKRNLFTQIFPPLRHFYLFRLFPFDIFLLLIGHYLVLVLQQPIEKKFSNIFPPKFNWFIGNLRLYHWLWRQLYWAFKPTAKKKEWRLKPPVNKLKHNDLYRSSTSWSSPWSFRKLFL